MNAGTIEIGPNLNTVLVLLIAALPTIVGIVFGKKATAAATKSSSATEEVAKQLRNNGGSSALDKLQRGHTEILEEMGMVRRLVVSTAAATNVRLDKVDSRLDRLEKPPPATGDATGAGAPTN